MLIEDLYKEIGILVPSESYRGRPLAYWKFCKYLGLAYGKRNDGRYWNKIDDIKKIINNPNIKGYNPDFKFNNEILEMFKLKLKQNLGDRAKRCLSFIDKYMKENPELKEYAGQQWHLYNPNLNAHYFDIINSLEKAYWFGVLSADGSLIAGKFKPTPSDQADGKSIRYRYTIQIELNIRDMILLERFCDVIGIDYDQIKIRTRFKHGKKYRHAYLRFDCKPMAEALLKHRLTSPKTNRISLPKLYTIPERLNSRKLLLAWLRGYYDGDGWSNRSIIGAANKQLLIRIRHTLEIKNPVRMMRKSKTFIDENKKFHIWKSFYTINIGIDLIKEQISIFEGDKLFYLKRKNQRYF